MNLDWKFFVTIAATIIGVVVPIWIWNADLSSNALSMQITSSIPLQPKVTDSIPDLQVSIDGSIIESPYLTTIKISNSGSKSIPSSSFESPVELRVSDNAKVVRARVTSTQPEDIRAEVSLKENTLLIEPILLNPKDSLTISIITSGKAPLVSPRARISGIPKVTVDENENGKINWKGTIIFGIFGVIFSALYFTYSEASSSSSKTQITKPILMATMVAFIFAISMSTSFLTKTLYLDDSMMSFFKIIAALFIPGWIAHKLITILLRGERAQHDAS